MSLLVAMRKILGGAESCGMVNCGNLRLYQQLGINYYDHVDSIIDGLDMSRCTPLSLLQKAVSGRDG